MLTNNNGRTYRYKAEPLSEQVVKKDENGDYHITLGRFVEEERQHPELPEFMNLVNSKHSRLFGQLDTPIDNPFTLNPRDITHSIINVEIKHPFVYCDVHVMPHNDIFGALVDYSLHGEYYFGVRGRGKPDGQLEEIIAIDLLYNGDV